MQLSYHLPLHKGITWCFQASGQAVPWLQDFARTLGLSPGEGGAGRHLHFMDLPSKPGEFFDDILRRLPGGRSNEPCQVREYPGMILFLHPSIREILCALDPGAEGPARVDQMRRSLLPAYIDALLDGGLPVHGALVEIEGSGVILAGRSGEGKSTSCRRLPRSWRVLGDDLCLVVRGDAGEYRVHPLPTWSALREGKDSGSCRAGYSVPLRAVFFLGKSQRDDCLRFKKSTAAVSLATSSLEVLKSIKDGFPRGESESVQRSIYHNASSISGSTPAFMLRVSLNGFFWETMEDMLWKEQRNRNVQGLAVECTLSDGEGDRCHP